MAEDLIGNFIVGVSMILEKEGNVLLGKRVSTKDFGAELWEFPSGRLGPREQIDEGLIREMREELDINVQPVQIIDAYGFKRGGIDLILLNYYCRSPDEPHESTEHDILKWCSVNEAKKLLHFDAQKNTLEKFFKMKDNLTS